MKEDDSIVTSEKLESPSSYLGMINLAKALLVGIYQGSAQKLMCEDNLNELERLAENLEIATLQKVACPLKKFDASTYLGSGKVEELIQLAGELEADLIIIDDEITPGQQRNLEKLFQVPVIDRTEVILEVFSRHAKTREARLQIELAKVRYEMPRLKRLWTHLSRQRGGSSQSKGEGEKQIEIDKRLLKTRIERLSRELEEVKANRNTQRSFRKKTGVPTFAIIGYTNVGKSTLLKALTDADVLVEDKLFATLDTTTRKFILPNKQEILLIDTVGFIRKLPHTLVAAFRSTLEEATEADILIHLIDVSHPCADAQAEATYSLLKELNASHKPVITVLNKIDAKDHTAYPRVRHKYPKTVEISALNKTGFNELIELMLEEVGKHIKRVTLKVPQSEYGNLSEVERLGHVLEREYVDNDLILKVEGPVAVIDRLKKYWI